MPIGAGRSWRYEPAASIASGASQSPVINLEDVIGGGYQVPAAFTNVGATNLMRFGVSNNHGDPSGTAIIALLPTTTIATAQNQQQAVSQFYPFLPDVFKFKAARFDGVANEGAARVLNLQLLKGYVTWKRIDVVIANGGTISSLVPTSGARGGSFLVPAAFTGTTVTYLVGDGGTMLALNDVADADISQGVAVDRWIPIPDGCFAFPYFQIVSGGAEAAARVLRVDLKFVG